MAVAVEQAPRERVEILGIPVDVVGFDDAVARIESFLAGKDSHLVATADASGIAIALNDPEFRAILASASLVTPDSAGVLWAGRRAGARFQGRVSGVELVDRLCELSAEKGYRLYFLGSAPGIAETAAEKMRLRHPGCRIVGTGHGYFPASDDTLIAAQIAESSPDVLFAAMGIPRQEKFLHAALSLTGAKVGMGVGGTFDVFSGRVRRAPRWLQRLNLEWMWRTLANPKKLAKAKYLPVFVWRVMTTRR